MVKKDFIVKVDREYDGVQASYDVKVHMDCIEHDRLELGADRIDYINEQISAPEFALEVVAQMEFNNTRDAITKFLDICKKEQKFRQTDLFKLIRKTAKERAQK